MDTLHIRGRIPLSGIIPVSGAKNSALKLMAAALLTDETVVLENMPLLDDTRFMAQLMGELGVAIQWQPAGRRCAIRARELTSTTAPHRLVSKMRATFNVLGPLLAREGEATVSLPGGCAIGARPVDMHLAALKAMGADIRTEDGYVVARAAGGLRGATIRFGRKSVGATEQVMLAAVLARGQTVLDNAACEPEIVDLATCLMRMGARITGAGTARVTVDGVATLDGASHRVMPDRIEAGAYAIAAAATGGDVLIDGIGGEPIRTVLEALRRAGVECEISSGKGTRGWIRIRRSSRLRAVDIDTEPYPGFPTDLQAPFMALATMAEGESCIAETIFENRFRHAPELCRLGARISLDGNRATVTGVARLSGAEVIATDLRASMSLVVAGLAAEGATVIHRLGHLDRGFEGLERKLAACGADVVRRTRAAPRTARPALPAGAAAA